MPKKIRENMNTPTYWDAVYSKEISERIGRPDEQRWGIIANTIRPADVVLDFGCGWGEFLGWLAKKRPFAGLIGIDYSSVAIRKAMEIMPNFEWHLSGNLSPVYSRDVNVITMQHVLEHCDNRDELINEAYSLLKPNGHLIIVLPLYDNWVEHPEIWKLEDVRKWMKTFNDKFSWNVIYRPTTRWTTPKNESEEAIIVCKKKGK